jgi:hypothetical protein
MNWLLRISYRWTQVFVMHNKSGPIGFVSDFIELLYAEKWWLSAIELPSDYQNEVTSVICRHIKVGYERDYENWLRRFMDLQRKAPGFRGITIIIPGSSKSPMRYIIRRFSDKTSMERWDNSKQFLHTPLWAFNRIGNMVYSARIENS